MIWAVSEVLPIAPRIGRLAELVILTGTQKRAGCIFG